MAQATAERKLAAAPEVPPDPAAELAAAERELAENTSLLEAVEAQLAGGDSVPAARHHELQDLRRFGELRVQGIRARIAAARRDARLAALRDLGDGIRDLAENGPLGKLAGALRDVAAAVAAARNLTDEHDRLVLALVQRATNLDAGPSGPSGLPRAASGGIAVFGTQGGMTVVAGTVRVEPFGYSAGRAIDAAVHGKPEDGAQLLAHAVTRLNDARAPHYLMDLTSGQVFPSETIGAAMLTGLKDHRLRELKDAEIAAYLAGEEFGDDAA